MIGQYKPQDSHSSVYTGAFSRWKAFILSTLAVISALIGGYFMNSVAYEGVDLSVNMYVVLGVVLAFFLAFQILAVLLIDRKLWLLSTILISGIALGAGFFANFNQTLVLAVIAAVIILCSGGFSARAALDDSLKVHFFRFFNNVLRRGVLALALFASIIFFNVFSLKPFDVNNPLFPQAVFEASLKGASRALQGVLQGMDFSLSLREIASKTLDQQIASQPTIAESITPALRKQLETRVMEEYQTKLEGVLGQKVNPDEKLSDSIYFSVLGKINNASQQTKLIILIICAALVFFGISAISPIIRPIIALLAFIIYEILITFKFCTVVYENKSKETIVLS